MMITPAEAHLYQSICLSMLKRTMRISHTRTMATVSSIQPTGYWFCVITITITERMVLVRHQRTRVNHQHELSVRSLLASSHHCCSKRYITRHNIRCVVHHNSSFLPKIKLNYSMHIASTICIWVSWHSAINTHIARCMLALSKSSHQIIIKYFALFLFNVKCDAYDECVFVCVCVCRCEGESKRMGGHSQRLRAFESTILFDDDIIYDTVNNPTRTILNSHYDYISCLCAYLLIRPGHHDENFLCRQLYRLNFDRKIQNYLFLQKFTFSPDRICAQFLRFRFSKSSYFRVSRSKLSRYSWRHKKFFSWWHGLPLT